VGCEIEHAIVLKLHEATDAFWQAPTDNSPADDVNVIDATYVDDECIVLLARSCALLDTAIDICLNSLVRIFECLSLSINWKPGKTECLLKYRGQHAAKHLEARRFDSKLRIDVPGSLNCKLHVVQSYKHLGSVISIDVSTVHDAKHKCGIAMAAYAPISTKVFGSDQVSFFLKQISKDALVLSRLFFNAHVVSPSAKYISLLNTTYMRVVRRITNNVRFDADNVSDLEVRRLAGQPSVDCLLQRARLKYLARLLSVKPIALLALSTIAETVNKCLGLLVLSMT
jgi:hypothetical protein